jgi:hypothetical protein
LCARYRRLAAAGKPKVVVTTAIAREMVGFNLGDCPPRPTRAPRLTNPAYSNTRMFLTFSMSLVLSGYQLWQAAQRI